MLFFDKLKDKNIILASKSPRRQELLKGLDIEFEIRTKDVDESYDSNLSPSEICTFLSQKKAEAFKHELTENDILITSDTIVSLDGRILEKPKTKTESIKMISSLSENQHSVFSGVSITSTEKQITFYDETKVFFKPLSDEEIEYYVEKYNPCDKAGSYGIQEWIGYIGVEKIEGDFFSVMGLPLNTLYKRILSF